ncbi:hypothetical protein TARUN_5269 [Trichoderma arundinaceum]|uniref:Uncharacterized protein n=1 Tax=Trichoderma arundinaceum TaxID=490622 RepID=A0A395NM31_TRIAR|nr:hypothetical protein TARUN_5269 [Trichoderma arundinaceum]
MENTCEQIIKYDCGHLYRRIIPCVKQQPKRRHSVTCFSGKLPSYEDRCHQNAKLERRATLCQACEAQGKDREVYQNSTRRVSAPPTETNRYPNPSDGNEKWTIIKVSTSIGRSNSNPGQLPSQRLRRVRDTGDMSLRHEYARLESSRDEKLDVCRDRKPRPSNIVTQGPELDWFASGYVPLCHDQSEQDSSHISAPGLRRSDSMLKKLQKSLHLQKKSSDESFVCSTAREVERGENKE